MLGSFPNKCEIHMKYNHILLREQYLVPGLNKCVCAREYTSGGVLVSLATSGREIEITQS